MKAKTILSTAKTSTERAESYFTSIKRNIQKRVLDSLIEKKERLEDEIAHLEDFSLETDQNKGIAAITRDQAEERFIKIIDKNYELELVELELESKQDTFDGYFGEEVEEKQQVETN